MNRIKILFLEIALFLSIQFIYSNEITSNSIKLKENESFEIEFNGSQNLLTINIIGSSNRETFKVVKTDYGQYQISKDHKKILYFEKNNSIKKDLTIINGEAGVTKQICDMFYWAIADNSFSYLLYDNSQERELYLFSIEKNEIICTYNFETDYMKELKDFYFGYSIYPSDNPNFDFLILVCEEGSYVVAEGYICSKYKYVQKVYDNVANDNSYKLSSREDLPKKW